MLTVASIHDYLRDRISEALPNNVTIYTSESKTLAEFLNSSGVRLPAVFISYEGFEHQQAYERRPARRTSRWAIFFHGRHLDSEMTMVSLSQAIHDKREFQLTTDVETANGEAYQAQVTSGRYLALDTGFDSYQLDIKIN